MNNLERNLFSKHELRFNKSGKFKILMMSDIHEILKHNNKTLESMEKLIEKINPDLVILGGDNCDELNIDTQDELKEYLDIFSRPMEKRKIPWAHIFGNHDHDMKLNDIDETKVYEEYEYCISKHTEDIYGTTNFVLPIKHSYNEKIAFNVWGIDTNNEIKDADINVDKNMDILNKPSMSSRWDIVHFEQLMWYYNSSIELEKYNEEKINGIMFMHIPPWEFQYIVDNHELTKANGSMRETMKIGMFNSGLFSCVLQRKDIKCISSGHCHNNCFEGEFCKVKMCLDACAGYSLYGTDKIRGGRVFELDENDTENINTYMVYYKDL